MALIKNKKSIFFTIVSISLVSLFLITFMGVSNISFNRPEFLIETEFNILHSYTKELKENFIKDVLIINSINSLEEMLDYVDDNNGVIDNFQANFSNLMIDGSINIDGNEINISQNISSYVNDLDNEAKSLFGIKSNTTIHSIDIIQYEPWKVNILANISINASLLNISYNINDLFNYSISITGFRDPVYLRNFNYNHSIKKTKLNKFDTIDDVLRLIEEREYRHIPDSPSFIMRFENKTTNSNCCGIQSFINTTFAQKIINSNPNYNSPLNFSFVDYYSANRVNSCADAPDSLEDYEVYNITGISNQSIAIGFNLDVNFIDLYNISNDVDQEICKIDDFI